MRRRYVDVARRRLPALLVQDRHQSFVGERRLTARHSKSSYRHPLAPKDPSQRNIALAQSSPRALKSLSATGRAAHPSATAEDIKKEAQKALLLQLQQEVLWEGTVIDSVDHSLMQHFLKLGSNPKYREARQMVVIGGRAMMEELYEAGHAPRHLLVREGKEIPSWAKSENSKTDVVLVERRVADAVAPGNDGYVGDFEAPPPPPKENLIANHQCLNRVLVLDNVEDPGLLGTVLRTASGYQYDAIITTNHCADLYDHRVVRAARGAHFQSAVPIYTLRDEDGDDVYGMLNHIVERNNLRSLCFAAQDDAPASEGAPPPSVGFFQSGVSGAAPVRLSSGGAASHSSSASREGLSDFCLSHFTRDASEDAGGGYMLFAGPNHKQNMVRRFARQVRRPPTQLLLEDMPSGPQDLLVSLSVVLHALRPRGNWDYLPLDQKHHTTSDISLQATHASVDIGVNRLRISEDDLNLDEEEQIAKANLDNEFMRWRRLRGRKLSDYEHWIHAEDARVNRMMGEERRRLTTPWKVAAPSRKAQKGTARDGMPEWVPNIVDEYRQSLGRDALVAERERNEKFIRPSNYRKQTK